MNSFLFMTENRQFHSFIIIKMILIVTHDSAVRGEEMNQVIQEKPPGTEITLSIPGRVAFQLALADQTA